MTRPSGRPRRCRRLLAGIALVSGALLALAEHAAAQSGRPPARHGDWTLLAHPGGGCFIASRARGSEALPAGAAAYLYVSAFPKEGVRGEIGLRLAGPPKADSPVTASVGPQSFRLFTHDGHAFVGDLTDELKLLDAMRKGSTLSLQATGADGRPTTIVFSLAGLTAALAALAQGCR